MNSKGGMNSKERGKLWEREVLKQSLAVIFGKENVVHLNRIFEESLIMGHFTVVWWEGRGSPRK